MAGNRVLREQLREKHGCKSLILADSLRRRLAVNAIALGRRILYTSPRMEALWRLAGGAWPGSKDGRFTQAANRRLPKQRCKPGEIAPKGKPWLCNALIIKALQTPPTFETRSKWGGERSTVRKCWAVFVNRLCGKVVSMASFPFFYILLLQRLLAILLDVLLRHFPSQNTLCFESVRLGVRSIPLFFGKPL